MKFREWLLERFLPAWCREELLAENERLRGKIIEQAAEIERLEAYIAGVKTALRSQPRIMIAGERGERP